MDTLIIAFALFSLFFGAGNLIFPPFLGLSYGSRWPIASLGFILTGVGLASLAVMSVAKKNGDFKEFTSLAGDRLSRIIITIIILTIGPLGAIPRTGATSGEVIEAASIGIPYTFFILMFFILTFLMVIKGNKIIGLIGKYLTPLLLLVLFIMIINGILNPIAGPSPNNVAISDILSNSIVEGYNTMDALASVVFAPIIIQSIKEKNEDANILKESLKVIAIAATGLIIVYISLSFLGASASGLVAEGISRVELLIFIANKVLGPYGKYILSIMIVLACFTTAVGLTGSITDMIYNDSRTSLSHMTIASIISLVSTILSLVGVDMIIRIISPLLIFIYPLVLVMVVFNLIDHDIDPGINKFTFTLVGLIAFVSMIINYLKIFNISKNPIIEKIWSMLPFYEQGLPWLVPFIIILIIERILYNKAKLANKG